MRKTARGTRPSHCRFSFAGLPGASHGRKVQGTITFEEFKALLGPQSST